MLRLNFLGLLGGQMGKRHERGIFGPNRCAIGHSFRDWPDVQACYRPKIDRSMPGGSLFKFSWPFRWTNGLNVMNGAFLAKSVCYRP